MEDYKLNAINNLLISKGLLNRSAGLPSVSYKLLSINNLPIYARLANTPESLKKGLMGVEKLGAQEGCLLDFGYPTVASLWMQNCKINIQTAMVDPNGTITEIVNMSYSDPTRLHRSSSLVRYALEMNEDFFTNNNVKVGMQVKLL